VILLRVVGGAEGRGDWFYRCPSHRGRTGEISTQIRHPQLLLCTQSRPAAATENNRQEWLDTIYNRLVEIVEVRPQIFFWFDWASSNPRMVLPAKFAALLQYTPRPADTGA
jgi:hypothetical protein